jgi:hypothetical protein
VPPSRPAEPTPAQSASDLFVPVPEGPPAPVAEPQPLKPVASEHRLPVGVQIGVALLFVYLVLVYIDRRFLVLHRRRTTAPPAAPPSKPNTEDDPDAGLDLIREAGSGGRR